MTVPPIANQRRSLIIRTGASLLLVAGIVGISLLGGSEPKALTARYLLTGIACLAPFLLLLLLLIRQAQSSTLALGLAYGLGWGISVTLVILAIVGTVGRVVVLLTMWTMPFVAGALMGVIQVAGAVYRMDPIALMMVIILGLLQFDVARLAQKARPAERSGKSGQWLLGRVIGFAMLGGGAVAAVSAQSHAQSTEIKKFIKSEEGKRTAGMDAFHTMLRIQACAATYADSVSKGKYPGTLAAMGPGGSKCLDSAVANGTSSGHLFQYHPVPDSSGRNVGWWVFAPAYGLVADHTGALYKRRVGYYQPANTNRTDSAVTFELTEFPIVAKWVWAAKCIRDAATKGDAGYPAELTNSEYMCLSIPRNRIVMGDRGEYLLTYEAERPDRSGRFQSFVLHATARHYGQEGLRSFLIEPDGVAHVTTSQRPATSADPVYVGCETDQKIPCRFAAMGEQ